MSRAVLPRAVLPRDILPCVLPSRSHLAQLPVKWAPALVLLFKCPRSNSGRAFQVKESCQIETDQSIGRVPFPFLLVCCVVNQSFFFGPLTK